VDKSPALAAVAAWRSLAIPMQLLLVLIISVELHVVSLNRPQPKEGEEEDIGHDEFKANMYILCRFFY